MRSAAVLLLAALAMPTVGMGQNPPPLPVAPKAVIVAPDRFPIGREFTLHGDGSTYVGKLRWKSIPDSAVALKTYAAESADGGVRLGAIAVGTVLIPGVYDFALIAPASGDFDISFAKVEFYDPTPVAPVPPVVPAVVVAPPIAPPIPPVVAPVVFAGHLHATLIFDLAGDNPSTAAVRVSSIATSLKALDCVWYAADAASPVGKSFAPQMTKDGIAVPVVYVTDDAGVIKATIKAPSVPTDILGPVKTLRGAK